MTQLLFALWLLGYLGFFVEFRDQPADEKPGVLMQLFLAALWPAVAGMAAASWGKKERRAHLEFRRFRIATSGAFRGCSEIPSGQNAGSWSFCRYGEEKTGMKPYRYPRTLPFQAWCECGHISGQHSVLFPHRCACDGNGKGEVCSCQKFVAAVPATTRDEVQPPF